MHKHNSRFFQKRIFFLKRHKTSNNFLSFSLRFQSSIEFRWFHLQIHHFLLSFQIWWREVFPLKLWKFLFGMSCFFSFFSHFHFDLNLQSNFSELTLKFCIFSCHFKSNSVNFLAKIVKFFQICRILSFKCRFFSPISIFNRISFNSPFSPVISDLIEGSFSSTIVKFCVNFPHSVFQMSFFFLRFSLRFVSSIEFHWINLKILHFTSDWVNFSCKTVKFSPNFVFEMCLFSFFLHFSLGFGSSMEFFCIHFKLHFLVSFQI